MSHDNNSRQPGRGSRNPPTNRHPGLSSVGGPRRPENESVPPSEPPPFATLAPLGHALPQPGAEGGSGTAPPSYATRPPAGRSVQFRLPTLSENTARTGGPATTRTNARTMPAASRSVGGGAMTSTRRGTSIRPSRGSIVDINDHGVFDSSPPTARPGGTSTAARPETRRTERTSTGSGMTTRTDTRRSDRDSSSRTTATSSRHGGGHHGGRGVSQLPTLDEERTMTATGRTGRTDRTFMTTGRTTVGPSHHRTQGSSNFPTRGHGTSRRYDPDDDDDPDDEYPTTDNSPADAVRAQSQWYNPSAPPRPHPPSYVDQQLIYELEGDDMEVYRYVIPSERRDGGSAILREIDRRARHLRDPHFSALELWMRANNSGFLKKVVDCDDEGYTYWTIENHNYDVAWACAQQGWWILGTGIGKDKGNFFMEQKEGRS